jgi:hypothetical protein
MRRALAPLLLLLVACTGSSGHSPARAQTIALPPVAAAPGAGTAWLTSTAGVTGIGPDGRSRASFDRPVWNAGNGSSALRSADGGRLYVMTGSDLHEISAVDGHVLRSVAMPAGWKSAPWVTGAVSADVRWVGLARPGLLALIDLEARTQVATRDLPAQSSPTIVSTPNGHLLAMLHSGELTSLGRHGVRLLPEAVSTAKEIQCAAPPVQRLLPDGSTLLGYCPMNGQVWWFDIGSFKPLADLQVRVGNPFWGAPTFAPDGRTLVVFDSWDGYISMIDLQARHVVRSARPLPTQTVGFHLPFVTDAYAKGSNFAASLAPDGATLFIVGSRFASGVFAVDTSSMAVRARWLEGQSFDGVWSGGDAEAVYAIGDNGNVLAVLNPRTGAAKTISMSGLSGFAVP